MYAQITANKRKTWFLIALYAVVIIALGWVFGARGGDAQAGIVVATIIATVMTLFGYFRGDKVALGVSGAKEIDKAQSPELYRLIENLAIASGLPTPRVYIIKDHAPNAFATGRDPAHASVAVTTGLLALLDKTELEGVLAHELAHVKNLDIRVMTLVVVLVGVIILASDILLRSMFFRGRDDRRNAGALALIGLVLAVLSPVFAELIKLAVSRSREYLADASGAMLTRYPEGLARALEKIAQHRTPMQRASRATAHLYIANPFATHTARTKLNTLLSTHPPIEERIRRLRHA